MARVDTDQETVLNSILKLLRNKLQLNERNCYLTTNPLAYVIVPGGDFWISVSPGEGDFDVEMQEAAGENQLMDNATVTITVYVQMNLDAAGFDTQLLTNKTRGLLQAKKKLLKALVSKDLTDDNDDTFLRSLIKAVRYSAGDFDQDKNVGWVSTHFAVPFDWELTATAD